MSDLLKDMTDLYLDNLNTAYDESLDTTFKKINEIIEYNRQLAIQYLTNVKKASSYHITTGFVNKYNISDTDMLNYVKKLTIGDYVCSTVYKDSFLLGHNLIIFEPTRSMILENGDTITGITVYVKVDLDYKNKDVVFLISFHEADQTDFRPYRK